MLARVRFHCQEFAVRFSAAFDYKGTSLMRNSTTHRTAIGPQTSTYFGWVVSDPVRSPLL